MKLKEMVFGAWCLVPGAKTMLAAALCAIGLSAFAEGSGTLDDPWKVGGTDGTDDLVEAWTNGTGVLTVQGAGSVTNLADVIADWADIKGGITAINVASNGVTGAMAQAFAGLGVPTPVALTLPDGWQGELPDDGGNWYGAKVNPTWIPLAVKNVTFQQRWPWNGKVDIGFGVTGPEGETNVVITVKDGETEVTNFTAAVTIPADGVLATNLVWDAATAGLGDDFTSDDVTVEVAFAGEPALLPGVQLWENGPYFAECNVGAANPEEAGYYFWWGDTVGYTNSGSAWVSVKDGATSIQFSDSDTTAKQTHDKWEDQLKENGWIDDSGNLIAAHDAATAYFGAPWRMPTKDELDALVANCTSVWTNNWNGTGVNGRLVTGKTVGYTDKSIFLPAVGYGYNAGCNNFGSIGYVRSSTPYLDSSGYSWDLSIGQDELEVVRTYRYRWYGQSVRPVRDTVLPVPEISAKSAAGTVDLRTAVALDAGAVTVAGVNYSDTAWGAEPEANVTLDYTNETTGATGEPKTGLSGSGVESVSLPKKDGDYLLTHSTGDLTSFVKFTVTGYPLGSEGNPWEIGANAAADVIAFSNGTDTVTFKPVRGTVTKAGLETITNAMGGADFPAKLIAADGSETNDLVMVLGASGTAYDTLADALAANEANYTLYEVPSYFVSYDGGEGALGTMSVDEFIPDCPTNLTANAYEIIGYEFKGWTTNGTAVAYTNRHEGVNFVQPGETLSLTALWEQVTTVPADYAELTNMIAKATRSVTFTLEADIEFPADGKIEISTGKDVTFDGEGKFLVTNTIPTVHHEIIVGEGLKLEDFGRFVVTNEDVKAYYEAEGGKVVLRARGESEDFPWELGEAGVEAWMDGDTLLARPERGTASVAALQSVTNALSGYVPGLGQLKVISADGTATNDVQMLLGSDGVPYNTLADVLAADPLPETVRLFEVKGYWVSYDRGGNDGKGEPQPDGTDAIPDMATDMFVPTVPTNLTANAYVRTNFVFDCWLGWTNGVKVTYLDKAAGVDFCEPGATLALTAQWTRVAVPVTVTNLAHTTVSVTTNDVKITAKTVSTNDFGAGTSVYNVQTNADVTIVYRAVSGWAFDASGTNGTVVLSNVTWSVNDFVPEEALPKVVPITSVITDEDVEDGPDGTVIIKSCHPTADGVLIIPATIGGKRVIAIADKAFQYATWLKELVIEEGLTEIGNAAFDNCSGLELVKIPASVTKVGQVAFMRCFALERLEFAGDAPAMQKLAKLGYGICWGAHGFDVKVDPDKSSWDETSLGVLCAGWQKFEDKGGGTYTCTYDSAEVKPRITGVEWLSSGSKLTVNNVKPGLTYTLKKSACLGATWETVGEKTGGETDTLEFEIPGDTGASAFFRVTVSDGSDK